MAGVGLVLGGGGITGAAYHVGTLMALEMATGWQANDADVIIGTSSGAFTAAMIRGDKLDLDTFLDDAASPEQMSDRLRRRVYRRGANTAGVLRWLRRGLLPGVVSPDLRVLTGSPAVYQTEGIVEWMEDRLGLLADSWPMAPTVVVAYDIQRRTRVPFGTAAAPDVALKRAVAASAAVPIIFEPVRIDGRWHADGGITSGTNADLVLGSHRPLDLVIVIAPMAAPERRPRARFYERAIDRAGAGALEIELQRIAEAWPDTDVLVLRPDLDVLAVTRPNPLSTRAAVPTFLRTLHSLEDELARIDTWSVLKQHLVEDDHSTRPSPAADRG